MCFLKGRRHFSLIIERKSASREREKTGNTIATVNSGGGVRVYVCRGEEREILAAALQTVFQSMYITQSVYYSSFSDVIR